VNGVEECMKSVEEKREKRKRENNMKEYQRDTSDASERLIFQKKKKKKKKKKERERERERAKFVLWPSIWGFYIVHRIFFKKKIKRK
jgi:hypothetical protein